MKFRDWFSVDKVSGYKWRVSEALVRESGTKYWDDVDEAINDIREGEYVNVHPSKYYYYNWSGSDFLHIRPSSKVSIETPKLGEQNDLI